MNHEGILELSVRELLEAYKSQTLSPVDVINACFDQIERLNPTLNAYCFLADRDKCISDAEQSAARWAVGKPAGTLDGIPTSIKDEVDVSGWPTRHGSLTTENVPVESDSPAVKLLRDAGAIFLGKTTTPEYGHKGVTRSQQSGVTRNPWNDECTSGGSSGGAAVAAATNMGFLHLGSDGGGSIRIPSSFCGVFGIKPSTGTVIDLPSGPYSTIYSLGPIAKSVEDAAYMLDVLTEPSPLNWNAPIHKKFCAVDVLKKPIKPLKIAHVRTINDFPLDSDVSDKVDHAADILAGVAKVEKVDLDLPDLVDVFAKHWFALASWVVKKTPEDKRKLLEPSLLHYAKKGDTLTLEEYIDAEVARMHIGNYINSIFVDYDLILMPTVPMGAFGANYDEAPDGQGGTIEFWTPFTFIANLTKCPAASIPCGFTEKKMPIGAQIIGPYLTDENVMHASKYLEDNIKVKTWLQNDKNMYNHGDVIKTAVGS